MKNIQAEINIDKLKLCYSTSKENIFSLINSVGIITFENFKLCAIKPIPPHRHSYNIQILFTNTDSIDWLNFGKLHLGKSDDTNESITEKSDEKVWIELYNEVLYTKLYNNINLNIVGGILGYMTNALSLSFNNCTRLDIAIDTTLNLPKLIYKNIKNKDFVPIINGKAYLEAKKEIPNLLIYYGTNRERLINMALYIKSSDKNFEFNCYNKGAELLKTNKSYIKEFQNMPDNFYRAEIRLKNIAIREFFNFQNGQGKYSNHDNLEDYILQKDFLISLWAYYSNRLIRFQRKRKTFSIIDLIICNESITNK